MRVAWLLDHADGHAWFGQPACNLPLRELPQTCFTPHKARRSSSDGYGGLIVHTIKHDLNMVELSLEDLFDPLFCPYGWVRRDVNGEPSAMAVLDRFFEVPVDHRFPKVQKLEHRRRVDARLLPCRSYLIDDRAKQSDVHMPQLSPHFIRARTHDARVWAVI